MKQVPASEPSTRVRLWHKPDFVKLWSAYVVSLAGAQVSGLAVPLTAVIALEATPSQMGVQSMCWTGGMVLAALVAGPWVDRLPRRRLMIAADIGRALLVTSVAVASVAGILTIEQLWIITFGVSALSVVFDVGSSSFLPSVLQRQDLVGGNSALEASRSVVSIAGPGAAGPLVQLLTAPIALLVDGVSYISSALFLGSLRVQEEKHEPSARKPMWREVGNGLRMVVRNPVLRALAGSSATVVFFLQFFITLQILYLTRSLDMTPAMIGVVAMIGGGSGFIAALLAASSARRFDSLRIMIGGLVLSALGGMMVPIATGSQPVILATLMFGAVLNGIGGPLYNINVTSIRQAVTPNAFLGRVNATMRFLVMAATPASALAAGFLAESMGVRPVLAMASGGQLLACLWLVRVPFDAVTVQADKGT